MQTALRKGTAFAHLAFREVYAGRDVRRVPIGFILSHETLAHPLDQHTAELREAFPGASNVSRVLPGEYAYVHPSWRGKGQGKRLFDAHEAPARENGYTHIMTSVHSHQMQSRQMRENRGYVHLATRPKSGFFILVRRL